MTRIYDESHAEDGTNEARRIGEFLPAILERYLVEEPDYPDNIHELQEVRDKQELIALS